MFYNNHFKFNLNPKSLLLITIVVCCAGAGLFAVNVGTARAETVYVATDGSGDYNCDGTDDHIEINQAISYVNSIGGGTVHLKAGTYVCNGAVLPKSHIIFEGAGQESTILEFYEHGVWGNIYCEGTINTTLQNFTMDSITKMRDGIVCDDAMNITIQYVTVKGLGEPGDNFLFEKTTDSIVRHCIAKESGHDGFRTGNGCERITFSDNLAWNLGAHGIRFYNTKNCIAERNRLYAGDYGILVSAQSSGAYGGNIFRDNYIDNTKFANFAAIKIQAEDSTTIENETFLRNIIDTTIGEGFWITGTGINGIKIINNVIYNSRATGNGYGIYVESGTGITATNNIITNCKRYGIYGNGITSTYNNVWNNEEGNYGGGASAGTGDISQNPLFADVSAHDFYLKSTAGRWDGSSWVTDAVDSLCIDAGDLSDDYSNEPSPNGDRINMGAYGNTIYASKSDSGAPDTTPPTITSHAPSGTDVAVNTNISTIFSEAMNQSLAESAFSISPNVAGSFSWSSNQMLFNPSSDLSNETTYTITINTTAEDLAGNNLQSSYTWNFTTIAETPPDTTPPVRSNSSPSGTLTYGTTSTTLSLTTDENATCRYSTSAGTSYSSMSNTFSTTGITSHSTTVSGLSNGSAYTYYIRCIDSSSNANTNDYTISFSIGTEPQTNGLVGHWKFDESSGDTATDSSGNNNNGILTNMDPATDWVEGKIGNALDFDGQNDYVNAGDDASLNLTSAFTISVWVKAISWNTRSQNTIVVKDRGSDSGYRLSQGWGSIAIETRNSYVLTGQSLFNVSLVPVNEWHHIVGVYDGAQTIIYLDGVEKDRDNCTGYTIAKNDLHIGSSYGGGGSYFHGATDDVRIYSRALTPAEVLAHYNEGNTPQENHLPIGSLDTATQSQITGWAYDLNARTNPIDVHIYIDGTNVGSAVANQSRPDLVEAGVCPDPNHGFTFSTPSLSIGEHTVSVYAINQPEGTNPELNGSPKTFNVSSSDSTPPTGSIQINSGNEKTNSQNVNLTISANDPSGLSEMKISNSNDFNSVVAETYNTIKTFILSTGDGIKTICIWFKDTVGNWTNQNNPETDTIILDTTSPTISNISISNITTNTALISFQTNEPSTSYIEYGLTSSYGNQTNPNPSLLSTFNIQLSNLSSDTTYHFKIISKDELENESNSIDQTFKTIGNPDTTAPNKITDLSSSNISQTSADLKWTSKGDDGNNGTSAQYDLRYFTNQISDSSTLLEKNNWWNNSTQLTGEPIPSLSGTEQYISVGLSSNTNYYFIIKSADEVPNWSDYSNILSFKTLTESAPPPGGGGSTDDLTPPSQPSSFKAIPADSQITLNWKNPNDLDFVRVTILRISAEPTLILTLKDADELFKGCPTNCQNQEIEVIYEGTNQQYTDINLNNDLTYYYSIFSYDKKPNYSEILSLSSKPIEGLESIEIPNGSSYPEGTLLKTPDSFKIYIIINQKKKWIPTPEVFETLGCQWTNITIIDKNQLTLIPDYEDNLIRAINDFKVYLIVNGIKRHLPNPEIFLNYGFEWNEVKDVNQETINQYTYCNLIKESKKQEIYYLCPIKKIKRWLRSPEIFNSYPDNNWNNIQVISEYEMDHYPESNLIKLNNSNDVYLIEGNKKRLIKSAEEFEREGLDWNLIMGVNLIEFNWWE